MRRRDPISHYIPSLQRRLDFLKQREPKNSFDLAEIGALEWALVNLPSREPARQEQEPPCKTGSPCLSGKCPHCEEQEPVAWRWVPSKVFDDYVVSDNAEKARSAASHGMNVQPLYTAPSPAREWRGLTEADINEAFALGRPNILLMIQHCEAKLKERNHG